MKSQPVIPGTKKKPKQSKKKSPKKPTITTTTLKEKTIHKTNGTEFPSFQFQVDHQHGEAVEVTEGAEEDLVLGGMVQ